ncbi:MAG: prepilin-type N-terminal cleavage/methylation domain-containing protein [Candidatus Microsaccharimonas sp.]
MKHTHTTFRGFTIVELLIVIVVIGILATLAVVGYGGIQQRAGDAVIQSDLQSAATQLENAKTTNSDRYPSSADDVKKSSTTTFSYSYDAGTNSYCLTATSSQNGVPVYHIDSETKTVQAGACPTVSVVASQIQTATNTGCSLISSQLYCWGDSTYGQLGDGGSGSSIVAVPVLTTGVLSGKTITAVASNGSGGYHTCAIADGEAYCWGNATLAGKLGNNSTANSNVPVAVSTSGVLAGKTVTQITVNVYHSCAVADGAAYCWGDNANSRFGNGGTTNSLVPTPVSTSGVLAGKTVTALAAGEHHSCAIADGAAYCWGAGSLGRLGDNLLTSSSVPVAVSTSGVLAGKTVTAISSSYGHTCAIADGAAYCWGYNSTGQVGDNTTTNAAAPVAVSTSGVLAGKTVTAISAGNAHTCAIADGEAFCWGSGAIGKLGNNSTANSYVPVAVSTSGVLAGKTVTAISAGSNFSCVIAADEAYCWGYNANGKLGNGTTIDSYVPTAVTMP